MVLAVIAAALVVHVWVRDLGAHPLRFEAPRECQPSAQRLTRTELFLGLAKPDGSTVSDGEFQAFVDRELTPRFLDGFTVVAGNGQFRDARGAIVREAARVLIVLYAPGDRHGSEAIEHIRTAYKQMYAQESVLRVDEQSCVSF